MVDSFEFCSIYFIRDRICSDPFVIGSTTVRIHSVYTGTVRNWFYNKRRLICTNFVPVPNRFSPAALIDPNLAI